MLTAERRAARKRETEVAARLAAIQAEADRAPGAIPRCRACRKPDAECMCYEFASIAISGEIRRIDADDFGVWPAGVRRAAQAWAARNGWLADVSANDGRFAHVQFVKAEP